MATVLSPPPEINLFSPVRLLAIADEAALPSQLPSGAVRYELNDGRLVVLPPSGADHGGSQLRFGHAFFVYGLQCGQGEPFT
jgi:Uma2 family endonuclease